MKVTGLSGKSGTGKSYRAEELSSKIGADAIIDDGLLIAQRKIVAGESAKTSKTKIGAVKMAVFTSQEHADAVMKAIAERGFSHILVLGTSDEMVEVICRRLNLPMPEEIIHIEDISSEKDRAIASEKRSEEGMHTIPVPTMQVRKKFAGSFIDPKRAFRRTENKTKTIIRPTYSYLGSYEISDRIIDQIVSHVFSVTPGCAQLLFSASKNTPEGMYIRIIILTERGSRMLEAAELLQKRVSQAVAHTTGFVVAGVEVEVRGYKRRAEK